MIKSLQGKRICVYCASSAASNQAYLDAAFELGELLAEQGATLVYGGGSVGSMGAVADGALSRGGKVVGIIPKFMTDLEWQHDGVTDLQIVDDMRERKHRLLTDSDAVIALPGGCGTLEELFEAITLKRLGIYFNPIILINTQNFYQALVDFMDKVIEEKFLNPEHRAMWTLVNNAQAAIAQITQSTPWPTNAREFATVKAST